MTDKLLTVCKTRLPDDVLQIIAQKYRRRVEPIKECRFPELRTVEPIDVRVRELDLFAIVFNAPMPIHKAKGYLFTTRDSKHYIATYISANPTTREPDFCYSNHNKVEIKEVNPDGPLTLPTDILLRVIIQEDKTHGYRLAMGCPPENREYLSKMPDFITVAAIVFRRNGFDIHSNTPCGFYIPSQQDLRKPLNALIATDFEELYDPNKKYPLPLDPNHSKKSSKCACVIS